MIASPARAARPARFGAGSCRDLALSSIAGASASGLAPVNIPHPTKSGATHPTIRSNNRATYAVTPTGIRIANADGPLNHDHNVGHQAADVRREEEQCDRRTARPGLGGLCLVATQDVGQRRQLQDRKHQAGRPEDQQSLCRDDDTQALHLGPPEPEPALNQQLLRGTSNRTIAGDHARDIHHPDEEPPAPQRCDRQE